MNRSNILRLSDSRFTCVPEKVIDDHTSGPWGNKEDKKDPCTPTKFHLAILSEQDNEAVGSPRPGFLLTAPKTWYSVGFSASNKESFVTQISKHLAPVRWISLGLMSLSTLNLFATLYRVSMPLCALVQSLFSNLINLEVFHGVDYIMSWATPLECWIPPEIYFFSRCSGY